VVILKSELLRRGENLKHGQPDNCGHGRDELYEGLAKTVPEKAMIAKKNENSANRGWQAG
jgi:hypothetical protein